MKAVAIEISFFEAFFKVHYTKTSRLTYPIPLPTSVAGIFGSLLGYSRKKASREFEDCYFGSILSSDYSESGEFATYILHKKKIKGKMVKGVELIRIACNPSYILVMAGEEKKIEEYLRMMEKGSEFLPFGGQNDFFPKDWKIIGKMDVETSQIISNYLPTDFVHEILSSTTFEILPVMHKFSSNPNFTFIIKGNVKVKEEFVKEYVACKLNQKYIALYPLNKFYKVGEW
ncbi:MAG: CRISPR-associated protein Cas5 [Candidatus Aenigmatarchaeota archaeon]